MTDPRNVNDEPGDGSRGELQRRIRRLESLVLGAMQPPDQTTNPASEPQATEPKILDLMTEGGGPVCSSFGRLKVSESGTTYKASYHWETILEEVTDLYDFIGIVAERDEVAEPEDPPDLALLSGGLSLSSKEEILSFLPDRKLADRLIKFYFNSKEPASMIIHWPTFLQEYSDFWVKPFEAEDTWTALLLSILSLAVHMVYRSGEVAIFHTNPLDLASQWRIKAAQCLSNAEYVKKPGHYTIQALLVYLQTEFFRSSDALADLWSLNGVTVGLALRLGLHRDPDHYSELAAFEGEMRRRAWALLCQIDLMYSYQIGLPRVIRHNESDTKLPSNFQDEDIDQNMASLPPARPDTDRTPVSYTRAKGRIAHAFALVSDVIFSVRKTPFEEIMRLDSELEAAHSSIPDFLRMKQQALSFTDPPSLIMQRYNLDLLYLKTRCALHRKSLVEATADARYQQSKSICIQTALLLLERQATLYSDCQAGGSLEKDSWFVSSLTTADFLLAAMVICVDICHERSQTGAVVWDSRFSAIETSHCILNKAASASRDAEKAARVLSAILAKARGESAECNPPKDISHASTSPSFTGLDTQSSATIADTEPFDWVCFYPDDYSSSYRFNQAAWDQTWAPQLGIFSYDT